MDQGTPTKTLEWDLPFAKWFSRRHAERVLQLRRPSRRGRQRRQGGLPLGRRRRRRGRTNHLRRLAEARTPRANEFTELGVKEGDRVAVYMPMIPEAVVTMLAIVRLGAIHSVVFAGFSGRGAVESHPRLGLSVRRHRRWAFRRGAPSPRSSPRAVDEALESARTSRPCWSFVEPVVSRLERKVRDHWWHEIVARYQRHPRYQSFPAEQTLFIMYTSGTTAKPKGIFHTTGGYLTHVLGDAQVHLRRQARERHLLDAADIGWITGHSYIVYGPLINGVTQVMYEGLPDSGGKDRWWKIAEKTR